MMRTMTTVGILAAVLCFGFGCSVEVSTGESAVVLTVETDGSPSGKIEGTGRNSFSWQGPEEEMSFPITFAPGTFQVAVSGGMH